jgi:hypothetical protein
MSSATRRAGVIALDLLIVLFVIVVVVILDSGGGTLRVGRLKITMQTVWRPALWLVGALVCRLLVDRRSGPFGRPLATHARYLGFGERADEQRLIPLPGWREMIVVTGALTLAVGFALYEQLTDFYLVPDLGDPLFSMWRIGWVAHQIIADPAHLFNANIFYPEPGTLTYSDAMLLPALSIAPLLWLGVPVAPAYQLLFLSGFILSGTATYLLTRGLGFSTGASWIAALFFALCQYRIEHYSHLELQMAQWMPLSLLAGQRLLATGRRRYGILLTLAVGAQWYSSMYYGVFLTICAGVFLCVLAAAWRAGWTRLAVAIVALCAGVATALPLARVYKSTEGARGTRNADLVNWYSAHGIDYFAPNNRSVYRHKFVKGESERELFPHFLPLTLGVIGAVPPFSGPRVALFAFGLVAFDGSLGFNGHWYRTAYETLGPLKSMRVPARFAMLVNLALAVFAGAGAGRLVGRIRTPRVQWMAIGVLSAVFMAEARPEMGLRPVWAGPPSLYASLGPSSGAVLFEYPPGPDALANNFTYQYLANWHWTPMVNGYSGYIPQSYVELAAKTRDFPLGDSVPYLQQRGVTHVTLNCRLWHDDACEKTMERIAADPRFSLLTSTTWYGKPARLYRLLR